MSDQNANIDFNEIFKLAQNISKSQNNFTPPTLTPIDKVTNNQKMRIIKASLPYLDFSYQRNLAMAIKLMEFRRTLEFFNSPEPLHTSNQLRKEMNTMDFLTDIKNSCDEPQQKKINMLITILNMQSNMDKLRNTPEGFPPQEENIEALNQNQNKEGYNQFMNMVNKIIKEKDGNE